LKYIIFILSISLFACSNNNGLSTTELNASYHQYIASQPLQIHEPPKKFKLRSWQPLSNDFIIFESSRKSHYLAEMNGVCYDLKLAKTLTVNNFTKSTLSVSFNSIFSDDMPRKKCFTKNIYSISKAQVKEIAALDDAKPIKLEKHQEEQI